MKEIAEIYMGRPNVLRSAMPLATEGTQECLSKNERSHRYHGKHGKDKKLKNTS